MNFRWIAWTVGSLATSAALSSLSSPALAQEFSVGAYGDITYEVARTKPSDGTASTENSFAVPTLDLFMRGSEGKLSFVGEFVMDLSAGENEFNADVDRLQVTYRHREWLQITAGKYHTNFGYYNSAYPQGGAIYLLPVSRPTMIQQHDEQTLLPVTTVGLSIGGRVPFGERSAFAYDLDVMNGRGYTSDDIANSFDHNNAKAYNLRLRYEFAGLVVGGNAYFDWIPERAADPADPAAIPAPSMREQIFGGHIAYVEHPWHLIAEGYVIRHISDAETFRTLTGLVEVGYRIKQVTPYALLEVARFPSDPDPFWAPTPQQARGNFEATSVGAKWHLSDTFALKLELGWNHAQTDNVYRATTQMAFGF